MSILILFIAFLNFPLLFALLKIDRAYAKDSLSAGHVFIYFSLLQASSMLWYSLDMEYIHSSVFSLVDPRYVTLRLVAQAYVYTLAGWLLTYSGIAWGHRIQHRRLLLCFDRAFGLRTLGMTPNASVRRDRLVMQTGAIMAIGGTAVYLFYVIRIGGLRHLWENMNERISLGAGLGYFSVFYSVSIIMGSLLILSVLLRRKQYVLASLIITSGIFVFASLGARGPVAQFIFAVILIYHYQIRRVKTIFQTKFVVLAFILVVFMAVAVQFRNPEGINKYKDRPIEIVEDAMATFERTVINRFSRVERDVVILGYFDEYPYWLGRSYYSLLTAPIPRSVFESKPPTDTGVYLRAMAAGEVLMPPLPSSVLQAASWPLGNWEGYMNFGLPGFLAAHIISGFIVGFLFKYVKVAGCLPAVVAVYAILLFGGNVPVSSRGIINLISVLAVALFWSSVFRAAARLNAVICPRPADLCRERWHVTSAQTVSHYGMSATSGRCD